MARYRVKEKSFIGNILVEAGAEVEYDGIPHRNLEPIDKAGEKSAGSSSQADTESALRSRAAAAGVDLSDATAFSAWKEAQKNEPKPNEPK